jgi:hypothetical protein
MPTPYEHYLVIATGWIESGSGIASIMSLTDSRKSGIAQGATHNEIDRTGGPEGAMKKAEDFLTEKHRGLKKLVSEDRAT